VLAPTICARARGQPGALARPPQAASCGPRTSDAPARFGSPADSGSTYRADRSAAVTQRNARVRTQDGASWRLANRHASRVRVGTATHAMLAILRVPRDVPWLTMRDVLAIGADRGLALSMNGIASALANLESAGHVEVRRDHRPYRSGGAASDLTNKEQRAVRTALRFLRLRVGSWAPLAKALRYEYDSVQKVAAGRKAVTPALALRVARFADVPVGRAARRPVALVPRLPALPLPARGLRRRGDDGRMIQ